MVYFFSTYQIAEMAMRVEERGIEFYKMAAELTTDEKIKKIFLFLSEAEADHRDTFKIIMEEEKKRQGEDEYAVDVASSIGRLIETFEKAVFDLKSARPSDWTVATCLGVGIHVENGLITAYTELQKQYIDKFHDVLSKIIGQEKSHLSMLQNVKSKLNR